MLEAIGECYPDSKFQRCTVHFYRNVFTVVPHSKVKLVAAMLKAIHAQEDIASARERAKAVTVKLREMKLPEVARKVEQGVDETLTYMHFPMEHWLKIRSNNAIERLNCEIRRRTKVVGAFPDGNSALMLVCARLMYLEDKTWDNKLYLFVENLYNPEGAIDEALIGLLPEAKRLSNVRKILYTTQPVQ